MTRPMLDAGRRALTLPRRLVPVAMLLRTGTTGSGDPTTAGAISELERAGITSGGMLHPLAADLLAVVTGPTTVVSTEVTTDRTEIATVWHRQGRAVLGRPQGPDAFGLHEIEPFLLTFHLAQLTHLRSGPEPPFSGSTVVSAAALEAAEDLWHEQPAAAAARLVAGGAPPRWADRLVMAHRLRLRSWCATSLWTEADRSHHDAELRVLDAGDLGYWMVSGEPAETPSLRFTVISIDEVLNRIRALLPAVR